MSAKFLSLLSVLVVAQLASVADAVTIDVADWVVPYNGPKEWQASVGDTITFIWSGGHNVLIHPTMSCDTEGAIFIGNQPGASYTFAEADGSAEGTEHFFSCDIGDGAHCRFGQSLTVMVYSGEAPGGSGVVPDEPVTVPETEPPVPETLPETEPSMADTADEPMMDTASESDSAGSLTTVSVASLVAAGLALVLA